MALNISVFDQLALRQGAAAAAPKLDASVVSQAPAAGVASTVITGPALVCVLADEDQKIATRKTAGAALTAAATGVKIKAGAERYFELPSGLWFIAGVVA
jgi:hypothetical protein